MDTEYSGGQMDSNIRANMLRADDRERESTYSEMEVTMKADG